MRNGDDLLLADPEPRESRRTRIARRFTIGAAFLLLSIALIGVLYTVTKVRETQLDNKSTLSSAARAAKAAESTADRIEDCTSPNGECYKRGQAQTADAVGNINRVVILAAACAVGLDPESSVAERQALISACIMDRLAKKP